VQFTSTDNKKAEPLVYIGINTFLYLQVIDRQKHQQDTLQLIAIARQTIALTPEETRSNEALLVARELCLVRRCGMLCSALCSWEEDEDPSPQHRTNGVQCQQSQCDQGAKSSACWLVCLSARLLVNSSAKGSTLLDACWEEEEDPSPQHVMNGVQCRQGQQDQGAKSSARWLICLLACWLVCSSACRLVCSSTCQPNKAPSLMHAIEYNAIKANETGEPNHWLVGSSTY
jgi:hypothetical protein